MNSAVYTADFNVYNLVNINGASFPPKGIDSQDLHIKKMGMFWTSLFCPLLSLNLIYYQILWTMFPFCFLIKPPLCMIKSSASSNPLHGCVGFVKSSQFSQKSNQIHHKLEISVSSTA